MLLLFFCDFALGREEEDVVISSSIHESSVSTGVVVVRLSLCPERDIAPDKSAGVSLVVVSTAAAVPATSLS